MKQQQALGLWNRYLAVADPSGRGRKQQNWAYVYREAQM